MPDTPIQTTNPTPTETPQDNLLDQIGALATQFPEIIPAQFGGDVKKFQEHYASLTRFATQNSQKRAELEKQLASLETPAPEPEGTTEELDSLHVEPTPDAPEDNSGGVDWQEVMLEFSQHQGSLTEATRAKILKAGIPEAVLNATLAGQKALWSQQVREAEEAVGGKENLKAILDHVKTNFTAEEISQFNTAMENPAVYKRVLRGLLHEIADLNEAQPLKTNEPAPTPRGATGPVNVDITPYENMAQMQADMMDAKYNVDPVFTRQVQARIAKTLPNNRR